MPRAAGTTLGEAKGRVYSAYDIEVEVDDEMNGIAVIRCPQCDSISRTRMDSLADGSTVDCSCGFVTMMDGDGFTAVRVPVNGTFQK